MATHSNSADSIAQTPGSVSVYDTPEHKLLRKQLGFGDIPRELPEWIWTPNDRWQLLQGIMCDFADEDTTDVKARERALEFEHDERKFGPIPKR